MHAEGSSDGNAYADQIPPILCEMHIKFNAGQHASLSMHYFECMNMMNEISTTVDLLADLLLR